MFKASLISYTTLVALWNFFGLYSLSQGRSALGPTASLPVALVMLSIALILLLVSAKGKLKVILHIVISLMLGVSGSFAVYVTLGKPPTLWPSPFWYYAGLVLNGFGGVAGLLATVSYFEQSK